MVVKSELEKLGFTPLSLVLGEVEIHENLEDYQKSIINRHLQSFGFELIDDKKSRINTRNKLLLAAQNELMKATAEQKKLKEQQLKNILSLKKLKEL